jgi:hypothetical protein
LRRALFFVAANFTRDRNRTDFSLLDEADATATVPATLIERRVTCHQS